MELRKPTGEAANDLPAFENPRNLQLGKEPVTIKSGMIIECGTIRNEESKQGTKESVQNTEKYFAPVNVLSCLEKFKTESGDVKGYSGLNPSCDDI